MSYIAKRIKNFLEKFFLINDSPHKIAAGAALGIFLGIVPGAGVIAALALSSLFRFNRLSTASASLAVNAWSSLIILPLAATAGGFIFNIAPRILIQDFKNTYSLGWKTFLEETVIFNLLFPLIIGFLLVSATISLVFYWIIFSLLKRKKMKLK